MRDPISIARRWLASLLLVCTALPVLAQDHVVYEGKNGPGKGKHVVLVSGDEEYRSEEALPMLGKMGVMPPIEVLDFAPLPSTLIEAWKKQLQSKQANPEQQAAAQAELRKIMAEAGLSEARTQEIFMRMGIEEKKLDLETDKAALDGALRLKEPVQMPTQGVPAHA